MSRTCSSEYIVEQILAGAKVLDVRSPGESKRASFPGAVLAPLLTDEERHAVGILYRHEGQDAAIALGHQLVGGAVREERLAGWETLYSTEPLVGVMCARGGLRSRITQEWLEAAGIRLDRLDGGYKSLRRYLIEATERVSRERPVLVIGGMTGARKTEFLARPELARTAVDLEAAAEHCGSGFGALYGTQPSQATFENRVAVELLRVAAAPVCGFLVEDESRRIGAVQVPEALFARMAKAPRVVIESSIDERVEAIRRRYVEGQSCLPGALEEESAFLIYLFGSLKKISRRLGGARTTECLAAMQEAIAFQRRTGSAKGHDRWIRVLLEQYYDPMYNRDLSFHAAQIVFRGAADEVLGFLSNHWPPLAESPPAR